MAKENYGKKISVVKSEDTISFKFTLKDGIEARELIIFSLIDNKAVLTYPIRKEGVEYVAEIAISDLKDIPTHKINDELIEDYKLNYFDDNLEGILFDLYLNLKIKYENQDKYVGRSKKFNTHIDGDYVDQVHSLGNFDETNLDSFKLSKPYYFGRDRNGFFYYSYNFVRRINVIQTEMYYKAKEGKFTLNGIIEVNQSIKAVSLLLRGTNTHQVHEIPAKIKELNPDNPSRNDYQVNLDFNFQDIVNKDFKEDNYRQQFLVLDNDGNEQIVALKALKEKYRNQSKSFAVDKGDGKVLYFYPRYTFIAHKMNYNVDEFDKENYEYLQQKIKSIKKNQRANKHRDVWLISEKVNKAQDNGYFLFKYLRENYPDKEVYYVIDKNSIEKEKIVQLGNVIDYKSKEHIELTMIAKKFISTHHYNLMLPIEDKSFIDKLEGARIFIQHGVMGTKRMNNLYGNKLPSFYADQFMVSSDLEKRMIKSDFNFSPDRIEITGLARFDELFNKNVELKKQISIIPTWRDWLQTYDTFINSEYFERYTSLIKSEKFKKMAEANNVEIILCLHPNMQQYSQFFESDHVKIINQGEVDVQHILKESMMLITDYSSVGFDFSFLEKPVLYYMFDKEKFLSRGSHLDLANDLPGPIIASEKLLLAEIEKYINSDFKMQEIYLDRSNRFIKYKDRNNCARIVKAIEHSSRDNSIKTKFEKSEYLQQKFRRLRRSKYYQPIMSKYYALCKFFLRIDDNTILFESNLAKRFDGNVKAMYEAICKEYPNSRKVISSNFPIPNIDDNTVIVERISPEYYRELAKSKIWFNDQNFPYYIKPKKNTTYVQTWHGTPLKKMFFDLKKIHGRDEGYKDRNFQAISQWNYLFAQSEFAAKCFNTAFKHKAEVIELGYPRNEILYLNDNEFAKKSIRENIGIELDKKVILYAPTFRDDSVVKRGVFRQALAFDLERIYESLPDDTVILLRYHFIVNTEMNIPKHLQNKIIDVSKYPSIDDLYLIASLLITDYSSSIFDYCNLEKPMAFYAYDYEYYKDELRGFYLNYTETMPGPITYNEEDLYQFLKDWQSQVIPYKDKVIDFKKRFAPYDSSNVSTKIINYLKDKKILK